MDRLVAVTAEAFGARVIMTSAAHERATDRVAEAAEHFAADIVVMIQGDEPMAPELRWTELKFRARISMRKVLRLTLRNLRSIPRVYGRGRRMHVQFESFKG